MILVAILALSGVVIALLVAAVQAFPTIDWSFLAIVRQYLPYLTSGIRFFNSFTRAGIVMPLLGLALALRVAFDGYKVVMWVVKKIPMFGVSD